MEAEDGKLLYYKTHRRADRQIVFIRVSQLQECLEARDQFIV
jgi:hypothetical protein